MPQQAATIESLPVAFDFVKAMRADGLDWGEGYRELGRQTIARLIETEMVAAVDRYFDQLDSEETADRRNGFRSGTGATPEGQRRWGGGFRSRRMRPSRRKFSRSSNPCEHAASGTCGVSPRR